MQSILDKLGIYGHATYTQCVNTMWHILSSLTQFILDILYITIYINNTELLRRSFHLVPLSRYTLAKLVKENFIP